MSITAFPSTQAMAMRELLRPRREQQAKRTITVADLCQAIANGLIPAVIDKDQCYMVNKQAVREYAERTSRARVRFSAVPSRN